VAATSCTFHVGSASKAATNLIKASSVLELTVSLKVGCSLLARLLADDGVGGVVSAVLLDGVVFVIGIVVQCKAVCSSLAHSNESLGR